ncbi:MAG: fatty acid desaturase [Alphaproteobacteria bacterium]|nr:fatty acid desaturase [Alphaproteobacteria bacterium]
MTAAEPRRLVRETLAPFRRSSDARAFSVLGRTWGIVAAAIALAVALDHPLATLAAIVVIATRQRALIAILHTASHGVFFRTRRWNTTLQPLFAWPNLQALELYGPDHVIHHRDVGAATPDALDYLNVEMGLAPGGFGRRTWRVFVRPLIGVDGLVATWETLQELAQNPRVGGKLALFWLPVVGVCAWLGALEPLALYWFVPMVWLRPVLGLWSELADHFGTRTGTRDHVGLFQSHFVSIYGLHHALHHRDPRVPCYREAEACAALARVGVHLETTRTFREFLETVYGEVTWEVPPRRQQAR